MLVVIVQASTYPLQTRHTRMLDPNVYGLGFRLQWRVWKGVDKVPSCGLCAQVGSHLALSKQAGKRKTNIIF